MKQLLYIDFETMWESRKGGYGLKQLSMVEYIRDSRFKAFGMGVAIGDEKVKWISGSQIANFCSQIANDIGWPNIALVCHNTKFDGMILREVYECVPGQFIDTKGMSKGVLGKTVKNHSLATVAQHFGMEPKGTMRTDGLKELTKAQEAELAEYCLHDVELCRQIFHKLKPEFPESQYEVMHRTIAMFITPRITLNVPLLEKTNVEEIKRRANIFKEIGIDKAEFSSNKKFPELLRKFGYDVPTKVSPRTGNPIPALALGDTAFVALMEDGNEELKALCEARIAAKSNLLETRSAKLAALGKTGAWPFDVEFSGADQTHRFSGGSGAGGNPQNFTRDSALREAVEAPQGHSLVVGDFDKVECRMVAYLSRDPGLIAAIEGDAYSAFASNYYGRKITKEDKQERRFGKEAILGLGYGMGWRKFKDRVKLKTGKDVSEDDAKRGVNLYREMYNKVPALWEFLNGIIPNIATGKAAIWPLPGKIGYQFVELPSGLKMRYPNLRPEKGQRGNIEWVYDVWKKGNLEKAKLYGGKLLENISQALAGELCKEAMLKFGNRVTGLVHDEIHVVAKKGTELVTKMALQRAMTVSPKWFPELRLKAEVGVGPNWAEAK
jgi:DNA polymerase